MAEDDWTAVAPQQNDDWTPVRQAPATLDSRDDATQAIVQSNPLGRIWNEFSNGYREGFGDKPLGMSDKDIAWMQDHGFFRKEQNEGVNGVFRAFNEGVFYQGARALDWSWRTLNAGFRGAQTAVEQVGEELGSPEGGKYFAHIPDAFLGSPHPTGIPKTLPPVTPRVLAEARDLNVIGEARETPQGSPAEVAKEAARPGVTAGGPEEQVAPQMSGPPEQARAMAAERGGDDVLRGPEPQEQPNAWRQRFDQFVGKIQTGEDAKDLIRNAADENNEFPAARQGDIPLRQVEDLAQAAGVEAASINRDGVGRFLHNDNMVRNAMQAMLAATEDVKAAAQDVRLDGSQASLMKLQEALLRRDTWVEQVVGHRAEWGRTGNVFQEFLSRVKDEEGFSQFLKDKDQTPDGLRRIADGLDGLEPGQVPRFLSDMNKPTFWDKAMWYWVNALISGPVTHAKYVVANAAFAGYESAVVTPIAGAVGAVRRAVTGSREGVFAGEAAARLWGIIAGVPDAIKAGVQATKTGLQTPLPGELAQGIIPKQNLNVAFQQRPIPGWFGSVIGVPSRMASGIHSAFNFLGYRASIEAQAWRAAEKEGLSPLADEFWQRRQQIAANPTNEMMSLANEEGYRLTYINELGPNAKKVAEAIRGVKIPDRIPLLGGMRPFSFVMPFLHMPFNILARATEGTPLAFLGEKANADLMGRSGAVKQDMAVARLIAGGAVGAWAMNLILNDRMTGFGPTDEKERAEWMATGHQPYSIRIGDYWYSFNRFGSLGTMLGLYANLGEVIPHMKTDADELTKGIGMTVHATGRLLEDEVGMQGLAGLMDAINEPDRKGTRFVSSFAGSWLPYSSMLRQVASMDDPYMRETKSVVDGLRYYIPGMRESLLARRDWLGEPMANPGYGFDIPGAPGVSSIIQHRNAVPSALSLEMQTLDIKPTPPEDRIGGVKLTRPLFDQYQQVAGPLTKMALDRLMESPGWSSMPAVVREQAMRKTIEGSRKAAAAYMQARYPELIQAGVQQRIDHITGATHTDRPKKAPAALEGVEAGR